MTLLTLALYPTVKKSTENKEFKLILANYKAGDEHDFSDRVKQYFRYVPDYQTNVEIKEIHRTDVLQLFRIDNLFLSVPSWGYFVYEAGVVTELKHPNVFWNKIQELNLTDQEIIENYKSELTVDLEQFNKVFSELSREDKMNRYCELFYSTDSDETFELIKSQNQIDQILTEWPKSNGMFFGDEPIIDNFDFLDSLRTNQEALWTFDMGLNVFTFTFDESNNLTDCNIEFKGNLGNEVVHL